MCPQHFKRQRFAHCSSEVQVEAHEAGSQSSSSKVDWHQNEKEDLAERRIPTSPHSSTPDYSYHWIVWQALIMEHSKKMALVEPRLLEVLENREAHRHQMQPTATKVMTTLDQDMHDIGQRGDLSTEDKVKHYNQVLQRYLTYHEKQQQPEPLQVQVMAQTPTSDASSVETETLESVPITMKKKAKLLLQRLKRHPELKWNEKGEMIYEGQLYPQSHMADLVNDVLRKRKGFEPEGWKVFSQALHEQNVPQDLIGNKERWDYMHGQVHVKPPTMPRSPHLPIKRKRLGRLRWEKL